MFFTYMADGKTLLTKKNKNTLLIIFFPLSYSLF